MRRKIIVWGSIAVVVICIGILSGFQQQNFGGGLPNGITFTSPTMTISSAGNGNGVIALSGNTSGTCNIAGSATSTTATSQCANFNIGVAGSTSGILGLNGSASGTATLTAPATAGTTTNPIVVSNAISLPSGVTSTGGFFKTNGTLQVITTNYTTSATSLATAGVVPGLSFTTPASVASVWSFRCDLLYSQATAAAADLFGITTTGTAPTNLQVAGAVLTSQTGTQVDNNALITTATSTTVVTATPGAFGAIGTAADMFQAHLWGTIEAPSNASPSIIGISVASGSAADALTIYRGSSCLFY